MRSPVSLGAWSVRSFASTRDRAAAQLSCSTGEQLFPAVLISVKTPERRDCEEHGRHIRRRIRRRSHAVTFFVAQNQKYEGDQWWKWSIWIEGADEDLDQIESVTYTLHATFPEPIRTVKDRASKFQLRCSGWGVFLIPVEVRLKNGTRIRLAHQLQFAIPPAARGNE